MKANQGTLMTRRSLPFARRGLAPLGSEFLIILAVLFSLLFILSASLAFVNPEVGPVFRDTLNAISVHHAGLVLLGENVDVDVDEPSVTIRWSALGCGAGYVLPGSPNLHGSSACGVPAIPLEVFIDDSETPRFAYDPQSVPVSVKTGQRIVVQAQVQFDNDLVLDAHDTRLYPFDTYLVSTSVRATTSNSSMKDIPVSIVVVEYMPSFSMSSIDTDVLIASDGENVPARYLEIRIRRPTHARAYAMLIFGINWALCHFSIGIVLLSILQGDQARTEVLKRFAGALLLLFVIPQLRGAMPDAPGLDGVLIDMIGYFPQMTLAGLSAVILLLITAKRELDDTPEKGGLLHRYKAKDTLYGRLSLDGRGAEVGSSSSTTRWGIAHDGMQGHSRALSTQDFLLERALRVLDTGSQVFLNGSVGGSAGRCHQRSRSYYERKVV